MGQTVWSGSCDKTIRVWDANTLDLVSEIGHHEGWVSCLAYGAGLVWSASTDGFVRTFFNLLIFILVCGVCACAVVGVFVCRSASLRLPPPLWGIGLCCHLCVMLVT